MPASFSWKGYDALSQKLARLQHPQDSDVTELLEDIELTMQEGNKNGLISGIACDGTEMRPPGYRRSRPGFGKRSKKTNFRTGFGPYKTGLHDNLTVEEYMKLTGACLVPRTTSSRAIKNFGTRQDRSQGGNGLWRVEGAFVDVVDTSGHEFLQYFNGKTPVGFGRNIWGIRPSDVTLIKDLIIKWANKLLKG